MRNVDSAFDPTDERNIPMVQQNACNMTVRSLQCCYAPAMPLILHMKIVTRLAKATLAQRACQDAVA